MVWDQLLSSWAWCLTSGAQNHTWPLNLHILVGHALGNCQNHGLVWLAGSSCWHHGCCQLDLGDWLASQSPNPSWQHRVSLKHLQNTVILCHFVSLICMLCHMGGWDMVCRHLAIITHNLLNSDKTHGVIYNSGVGAVGLTSSKKSDFANQNLCDGGLPHTGWCLSTCCFWKNCHSKAWKVWTTKLPN